MDITTKAIQGKGVRLSILDNGAEVGRAFVYFLHNDLHEHAFGFLEDVFVEETQRGKGYGKSLVARAIEEAKKAGCYKLICTSRYSKEFVHALYTNAGFKDHGKEFRIDF